MKRLKNIFIGIMFSVLIYNLMGLFFVDSKTRNNILATIMMGAVIGGFASLYETKLSLLTASFVQMTGSLTAFLLAAYFCHWFPFKWQIILTSVFIFLVIFFTIWTFYYLQEKKRVSQMNQQLK